MRDRTVGETFYMFFTTRAFATGIPTVLAGTPVVSAYEDNSITQITAGITLGVDHDSVVGLNLLTLVATGANGYEAGKDYSMVITTGTVGGVSVVGEVVGEFSLGLSSAFTRLGAPAGASVSADILVIDNFVDGLETAVITNAAGADIAADIIAIKAETALIVADTNELQTDDYPTTIAAIQSDTDDIQTRLPAALVGGRIDSDIGGISTSAIAADNLEESALGIVTGAAVGTPTTTVIDTDLTETTDDHFNGRILTFITGAVTGQSTDITSYNGTTRELTVTALTNAPAATDTFVIT